MKTVVRIINGKYSADYTCRRAMVIDTNSQFLHTELLMSARLFQCTWFSVDWFSVQAAEV